VVLDRGWPMRRGDGRSLPRARSAGSDARGVTSVAGGVADTPLAMWSGRWPCCSPQTLPGQHRRHRVAVARDGTGGAGGAGHRSSGGVAAHASLRLGGMVGVVAAVARSRAGGCRGGQAAVERHLRGLRCDRRQSVAAAVGAVVDRRATHGAVHNAQRRSPVRWSVEVRWTTSRTKWWSRARATGWPTTATIWWPVGEPVLLTEAGFGAHAPGPYRVKDRPGLARSCREWGRDGVRGQLRGPLAESPALPWHGRRSPWRAGARHHPWVGWAVRWTTWDRCPVPAVGRSRVCDGDDVMVDGAMRRSPERAAASDVVPGPTLRRSSTPPARSTPPAGPRRRLGPRPRSGATGVHPCCNRWIASRREIARCNPWLQISTGCTRSHRTWRRGPSRRWTERRRGPSRRVDRPAERPARTSPNAAAPFRRSAHCPRPSVSRHIPGFVRQQNRTPVPRRPPDGPTTQGW